MSIEVDGDRAWLFDVRSCGELPGVPLHTVLYWIVQQLHFGCWSLQEDDGGDSTTLVVGRAAAPSFPTPVVDTAIEHDRRRQLALDIARILARAREEGTEPQYSELSNTARLTATDAAYMNTEFYYAFQLVALLQRIRQNTFVFSAPPIKGPLPAAVSQLLGEATRSYLFRLNRSCVALCRSLVEAAVSERVDAGAVLQERFNTKKGEVECLINVAIRDHLLTPETGAAAHRIRKAGNGALHGAEPSDGDTWGTLLDTRRIVEEISAARGAA